MPKVELVLPRLHAAQQKVKEESRRFNVLVCGRRWGKTTITARDLIVEYAVIKRLPVAYCEPSYNMMVDVFEAMLVQLSPVIVRSSRSLWKIWVVGGAVIDFWSLSSPDTIRGHPYGLVIFDEAGLCLDLQKVWDEVFRATLFDLEGVAWFVGTPKGYNFFRELYIRGQAGLDGDPAYSDWISWQMPTSANPHIPESEIIAAKNEMPESAYLQEVEAQFLDDGAGVFRKVDSVIDETIKDDEEPRKHRIYTLGVDWARYSDFTVITVLRDDGRQVYWDRFNGLDWKAQIERVARVAVVYNAMVVGDSTSVGDPLQEQLRDRINELAEKRAGYYASDVVDYLFTNRSKREIMDALSLDIERREVALRNIPTQINEFKSYMYDVTKSGNVVMSAPPGMHDDCVCSFALANWGRRRQGSVTLPDEDKIPNIWGVRVPDDELPGGWDNGETIDEYRV